jgi:hypothetical protein
VLLPKRVSLGARRVVSVAAALDVSLLVDEGGSVLSWGARHAPLGYEVGAAQCTPRQVRFGAARDAVVVAVAVVAANEHCLAVAHDGRLFAWGSNARGQLAMPPSACPVSVTPCAVHLNFMNGASGAVHIVSAAAGPAHCAAVCAEGRLWSWGLDHPLPRRVRIVARPPPLHSHTRPHGTARPHPVQVVCGKSHSAALTADGSVFAWEEEGPRESSSPLLASLGSSELPLPAMRLARLAAAHDSATRMHAVTADGRVVCWERAGAAAPWRAGPRQAVGQAALRQAAAVAPAEHHCAALVALHRPQLPSWAELCTACPPAAEAQRSGAGAEAEAEAGADLPPAEEGGVEAGGEAGGEEGGGEEGGEEGSGAAGLAGPAVRAATDGDGDGAQRASAALHRGRPRH